VHTLFEILPSRAPWAESTRYSKVSCVSALLVDYIITQLSSFCVLRSRDERKTPRCHGTHFLIFLVNSQVVFIGRNLKKAVLQHGLSSCRTSLDSSSSEACIALGSGLRP
jgi:hypothetical protein